jgi:hypothetical protein
MALVRASPRAGNFGARIAQAVARGTQPEAVEVAVQRAVPAEVIPLRNRIEQGNDKGDDRADDGSDRHQAVRLPAEAPDDREPAAVGLAYRGPHHTRSQSPLSVSWASEPK